MPDRGTSGGGSFGSGGSGITPRITRTNSVMPPSQSTSELTNGYVGPDGWIAVPGHPGVEQTTGPNGQPMYRNSRGQRSDITGTAVDSNGRGLGTVPREVFDPYEGASQATIDRVLGEQRQRRTNDTISEYRARQAANNASRQTVDGVAVDNQPGRNSGDRFSAFGTDGTRTVIGANGQSVTDTSSYGARAAAHQAAANSVFGTLDAASSGGLTGAEQFILNVGDPIDATTGQRRTSGNQDLRVGGQNASQAARTPSVNRMTIAGGVDWFRQLAASDQGAYNALVVQLRNAGYGGLPNNDAALPLNGYSAQAANAFIEAASDLSASGEQVPLLDWLSRRGQGYADYLAQQEADQAAADAYKPVDRQYDDADSVKATAKAAAIAALGRRLTDEEEARFEAHYRSKEDGYFDAIDAAGRAKTAARVENPNLNGSADGFVDGEEFDTERATQAVGSYAQVFQKMMGVS